MSPIGTIDTLLRIRADSRAAVAGLKPLNASLEDIKDTSQDAEKALKDLGDRHHVNVDDDEIERVKREISRLRTQMRDDLRIDINADTREAQRRIRTLQATLRILDTKDVNVDVDVDLPEVSLIARAGLIGTGMGTTMGLAAGSAFSAAFTAGATVGIAALGVGAIALGAIGVGAGIASVKMLTLSDRMANAKIAFTQFLGSSKKASVFLNDLQKFAAKTPFEFPELVETSKKLLAFGVESGDVVDIMTTLGDAAALTGNEVSDLADIWGQMQAAGTVTNEDLLQLTQRGIPAYQDLADAMGLTVPQIKKMASEGKLLSNKTLPVLKRQMDDTFGGGMAKQAETLGGKFSTLKDTLSTFGTEVGNALSPLADVLLDEIQPALDTLAQWARTHKGVIAVAITSGIAFGIDMFAALIDAGAAVVDTFADIVGAVLGVNRAMGTFLIDIGQLLVAANAIPGIGSKIPDDLGTSLIAAGGTMQHFGEDTEGALRLSADMLHGFADGVRDAADTVRSKGRKMAKDLHGSELRSQIGEVNDELDRLRKKPPSAQVDAKIDDAEKKLKSLNDQLDDWKHNRGRIRVEAHVDDAKTKLARIDKTLRFLKTQKPTPKVKADIKEWTAKRNKVAQDLKQFKKEKVTLHFDAKIDDAQAKVDRINGRLAELRKKKPTAEVKAKITLNEEQLDRAKTKVKDLEEAKHEALINVKVNKPDVNKAKNQLDETAKPGGKPRQAPISPKIDQFTLGIAHGILNTLTAPETKTIKVHLEENPTGDSLDAPGAVDRLLGVRTSRLVVGGAPAQQVKEPIHRAPKQTPIAVYLDGVEIATRIEARRDSIAIESVRRSA